jgi:hypothetical protein
MLEVKSEWVSGIQIEEHKGAAALMLRLSQELIAYIRVVAM